MNIPQACIEAAERNETVWLSDVRERSANAPGSFTLSLRLKCFDGSCRSYPVPVPAYEGEKQRSFVLEYLSATVYNGLAGVGGSELLLCIPEGAEELWDLAKELRERFLSPDSPYNKPVRVAGRICRALNLPDFSMTLTAETDGPDGAEPPKPAPGLRERVRAGVLRAQKGFYCGIDIGGTDIKLVTARDGCLETITEFDWNPAAYPTAEEITEPIVRLVREASNGAPYDGIGVSFPDVCICDRIVGGETPKTRGMRQNATLDYETEFQKLGGLTELLRELCKPGAPIRMVNDGHMAAITAAAELGVDESVPLDEGVVAFALGTGLGTGLLSPDGTVPAQPAEYYDILLDLGSYPARTRDARDLRSVCGENAGLAGIGRYVDQSSAFRYAYALCPALLEGFTVREGELLRIRTEPDLRKPCLERLMTLAQAGDPAAVEVFRRVGAALGQVAREMDWLIRPESSTRYLFGRFAKHPACFAAIAAGFGESFPKLRLLPAGDELAETPLMRALASDPVHTVAQFGQAVGAIYYCRME